MAKASIAATRQSADHRSGDLAPHRGVNRSLHLARRFARFSLAISELGTECPCQFAGIEERWRTVEWRRLFRRQGVVRRWRSFGELVMSISKEDHERIAIAIHSAEAKTSGQIVCVLAQASSHTTALPVFIAAVVALAMPWLLVTFTAMTVHRILSLQVVAFLVLLTLLCLPAVRVPLMPRKAPRATAHRFAMKNFTSRIARNKDSPGILIF